MAGETNISRPLSETEKQDIFEIGDATILDVFLDKLTQAEQKFYKAHKPFDRYSARMDFDEKIRNTIGELNTAIDPKKVNKKFNFGDLDKYGKPDRFILIRVDETKDDKLLDGMRQTVTVGKSFVYKAKQRGNTLTMFVPKEKVEEVEKWIDANIEKKLD